MFHNPYREQATASKSQRERLDDLLTVTAPHERLFLAGIAVVILVFLGWMAFGSVTRTLSVNGILFESGPRYPIVSKSDGRLETWLVVPGDRLEAGAPVARQTVPDLEKRAATLRELAASVAAGLGGTDDGAQASLRASVERSLLQLEAERIAGGLVTSPRSGIVMALLRSPGDALAAGERIAWLRAASEHPPRIIARVTEGMARELGPGIPVTVTAAPAHEPARQFEARVADAALGTWPDWLASTPTTDAGEPHRRVDFLVDADDVTGIPDGAPVEVHIKLEQHSPATLLARSSP